MKNFSRVCDTRGEKLCLTQVDDEGVAEEDAQCRQEEGYGVVLKDVSREVADIEGDGVGQDDATDPVEHQDEGPGLEAAPKHVVPIELLTARVRSLSSFK